MTNSCTTQKNECKHYIPNYDVGFKIVSPRKGEHFRGYKYNNHSLVFVLEGEVEFSYNDFLNRRFVKGDLFFLPQAAEMYGTALTNARMLVLTFNSRVTSLCDQCCLQDFSKEIGEIDYDFRAQRITPRLYKYVELVEDYISGDIRCRFLHELKQKELFVVMTWEYTHLQLLELFYPILGGNIDFKSRVMERYKGKMSAKELAQGFGMCYSGFMRKFKLEFGLSVQEWILKQKAKHIKLKLSLPNTTITDILHDFGFSDGSHFSRFCRKHYGCTPKELIKHIRGNKIEC